MQLRFRPYTLELKYAFTIATSSRTTTPVMLVEVEHDGAVGYGEAAMPPYLGETQATAAAFLQRVDLGRFPDPFQLEEILPAIDALAPGNTAAKAAVDIALHDWVGRKLGAPWHRIWGLDPARAPVTSFTIGIDTPEVVRRKAREAAEYKILKVKLGRDTDRAMIEAIREVTDTPITVDANQGWTNRDDALRLIEWLASRACSSSSSRCRRRSLRTPRGCARAVRCRSSPTRACSASPTSRASRACFTASTSSS